ncbi:hypothetical protein bcere0010_21330 [Bacillus cereus ATCC 4342]|nr:hypothetical protein bcere0010_21330 [Bacillus cereus ATCC 4342]
MCAELKEILRRRIKNTFIMMEFVEPIVSFFKKGFKNKCKSNLYKPI